MRDDLQLISDWIPHNATLLDLGCGDGTLLAHLKTHKQTAGYGLEINQDNLAACFEKGVNVLEQDLDGGLGNFQDHRFDYVVMTQALQAVLRPDQILNEMVRVGREAIITFPNFGHWKVRAYLLESLSQHVFRRRTGDHPVPVFDRQTKKFITDGSAHQIGFHGSGSAP